MARTRTWEISDEFWKLVERTRSRGIADPFALFGAIVLIGVDYPGEIRYENAMTIPAVQAP